MQQDALFQELEDPRALLKAAIAADVEAAGGPKKVAALLWPDSDKPLVDEQRLRNACLPKQKQLLDYFEIQDLKLIARNAVGSSHIHALESKPIRCKLHWITAQEEVEHSTGNLASAMKGLTSAMNEAKDLLVRLSEGAR